MAVSSVVGSILVPVLDSGGRGEGGVGSVVRDVSDGNTIDTGGRGRRVSV